MKADINADIKSYSLTGFERLLNKAVRWLFFYRMIWIGAFITGICLLISLLWVEWLPQERLKNTTAVLTCGSVVIGIFYAMLNYEVNHFRQKSEWLMARKKAAFDVIAEWHKEGLVQHLKTNRQTYEKYKHLIEESRSKEFSELVDNNEAARFSLITLFNYFECISIGISQQIHDEEFMRRSFRGIFIAYLNDYDFFIQYRRKKLNNDRVWKEFTDLATRWRNSS